MDGNGRWANAKGLPRLSGHIEGVRTVRKITKICGELEIEILTLYTFSSENWSRPTNEINSLMKLLVSSLRKELNDLMKNNVRFTVIGETNKLKSYIQDELLNTIQRTSNNTGLNLNLALNYGSRQEIICATKKLIEKIIKGELEKDNINEALFSNMLFTNNLPDPDLLIRTGGEFRLSNFLLWQIAYTEIHITETYWPSFGKVELMNAINEYQNRDRRFGNISNQLNSNHG